MKILLFGASVGGVNFIKNHSNDYEILAIIDNDSSKHGKLLNNIEIIHPNRINDFTYDKIIVTSMYVDSISKQLESLNIPKNKIEFASKNSMKVDELPFENISVLRKANKLIVTLSGILKDIPHFYTFGTLLGIARDGGLIPSDHDIDVAVFGEDVPTIKELLLEQAKKLDEIMNIKMFLRKYSDGKPASITIDCYDNNKKLFMINLDCMYIDGDIVHQELNDTPIRFFEGFDLLSFENREIRVPKNYETYLDYTYGDWKVVKKNTSFADNTLSFREPLLGCTMEYFYESKNI